MSRFIESDPKPNEYQLVNGTPVWISKKQKSDFQLVNGRPVWIEKSPPSTENLQAENQNQGENS